ncbi:MAG: N-acetylmuramoyl-L-alanine amidase [Holosporaceae bacterium]|jgi:N-acetylmuramoyl-L-alanine amidase|nr:N-acetylmuramoyl-L-alanine amidase [Holosporaceae bacterium]
MRWAKTAYGILLLAVFCFGGAVLSSENNAAATTDVSDHLIRLLRNLDDHGTPPNPIRKVYLKKEGEDYFFCIDFLDDVSFTPRVHTLSNGMKIILSFGRPIKAPRTTNISHGIIKGYFFEKFGKSSLVLFLAMKENVTFTKKVYTKNSIKIGFRLNRKRLIVIDPGHGGKDPGTKGFSGDYEKNIVLVVAIELREVLMGSGKYRVILTRDSDTFLPIEDRKKNISKMAADMLISLHTDSNDDQKVRGISVYTLPNLNLLTNCDQEYREDQNKYYNILAKSRNFAGLVTGYIPNACKISERPCRNSELKILKNKFPAVLLELGCVSNKVDNTLLHSREFREKVNNAILYALDDFFKKEDSANK